MENNFFKEIDGPLCKKLVIDLDRLTISHENRNLTNFFIESSKDLMDKTALNWLKIVDDATIITIGQCGNFTVMDVQKYIKTKYAKEIVDFTLLTLFVMRWEGIKKYVDVADLGRASLNLYYLAMSEAMSRKGFINIMGSGMISKIDTKVSITKEGLIFAKNIGSEYQPKNEFILPPELMYSKDDIGFPRDLSYEATFGNDNVIEKETAMLKDTIEEHSVDSILEFNKTPIREIKEIKKNQKTVSKATQLFEKKLPKKPAKKNKEKKTESKPKKKPNNKKKK